MPVEVLKDRVVLKHDKVGASAEILLSGATVISWKSPALNNPDISERLFVSSKAFFNGSKPVRGGIPVVFPCFGPPNHRDHQRLKQHGFARSEPWVWDKVIMDNEAGVSVSLILEPTESIKAVYDRPFLLKYVVTLAEHQLSTDLHVKNTSEQDKLEFQALFHSYLRVPSALAQVAPLQGVQYHDKTVESSPIKTEERDAVDLCQVTDSVYLDASQRYVITWPSGRLDIRSNNLKDVVLWNPQETLGIKLADMESGGWEHFICVEPGHVDGFIELRPGQTWIGQQVITAVETKGE